MANVTVGSAAQLETEAEYAVLDVQSRLKGGDRHGAMALGKKLGSAPVWVKAHEKLLTMLINICIEDRLVQDATRLISWYQRLVGHDIRIFEEAVLAIIARVISVAKSLKTAESDVASAEAWSLLSGEPLTDCFAQQEFHKTVVFATAIINHCTRITGNEAKYELLYQHILRVAFQFARDASCGNEFSIYSGYLRTHWENLHPKPLNPDEERKKDEKRREIEATQRRRREEHLETIMKTSDMIDAICETKILQLECAISLKLWRIVAVTMDDLKKFFDELQSRGKAIRKAHLAPYYEVAARLFGAINYPALHCAALIKHFRLTFSNAEASRLLASRTVLAILAVPATQATPTLALGYDNREKIATLERYLRLTESPTRASLCQDVSVQRGDTPSILDMALPAVRQIFSLLYDVSTVDICHRLKPHLAAIESVPELVPYLPGLEDSAVQAMLQVMSRCINRISITHLLSMIPFFSPTDYEKRLEKLLLSTSDGIQIYIDQAHDAVTFVATNNQHVVGALGALADQLASATTECYSFAQAQAKKKELAPESERPLSGASLLEALDTERKLMRKKQYLVEQRLANEEQRRENVKRAEEARREAEMERLRRLEAARSDKRREEADAEVIRQYNDLKAQLQRKWVLEVLLKRHPDFKVDFKLAKLGAAAFKEELTKQLTTFLKDKEYKKRQGLRDRDYLERAKREAEIPRILAAADAAKEAPEDREARLKKRQEQARIDHEQAVVIKKRLSEMEATRKAFESEILSRIQKVEASKTSKRDKQEEQLRIEKERREAEAVAEAAEVERERRQAEAAKATPSPASSPTQASPPAALGVSKNAWKPKSRGS